MTKYPLKLKLLLDGRVDKFYIIIKVEDIINSNQEPTSLYDIHIRNVIRNRVEKLMRKRNERNKYKRFNKCQIKKISVCGERIQLSTWEGNINVF